MTLSDTICLKDIYSETICATLRASATYNSLPRTFTQHAVPHWYMHACMHATMDPTVLGLNAKTFLPSSLPPSPSLSFSFIPYDACRI